MLNNATIPSDFPLRTLDPASQSVESSPEPYVFTLSLRSNLTIICESRYGGKPPEALCFGYVLAAHVPGQAEQCLFVGSQPGQYASAVILDWWFHMLGDIYTDRKKTIRNLYGEMWDDAPGTGKHLVIDFIRRCLKEPGGHITLHPAESIVNDLWEQHRENGPSLEIDSVYQNMISWTIDMLDIGKLRVVEKINGKGILRLWIIQAMELYARTHKNIPTKLEKNRKDNLSKEVPYQQLPHGVFIGENVTLILSHICIGAHIGDGTSIGPRSHVGSGVQIGRNVKIFDHAELSLGAVSPEQIIPTIIGDDCEIGADTAISGVIIEDGAMIAKGTRISPETDIYDYTTGTTTRGCIPANAVIMRGLPFPDTDKSHNSVTIIGRRKFSAKKWDADH